MPINKDMLNKVLDRRYDFTYMFDVEDGNPNGDPDSGNMPRLDYQTGQGFTTDGCIKRKIRNTVEIIKAAEALKPEKDGPLEGKHRYEIYFKHQEVLNEINRRAFAALGIDAVEGKTENETDEEDEESSEAEDGKESGKPAKKTAKKVKDPKTASERIEKARLWMCRNFYDVRTFGAVMSTGVNAGQVRGPVQITYARSVDRIIPNEAAITRKSVNTQADADKQIGKHGYITGTFGRKNTVSYGLYRGNGFVNPFLAMGNRGTGFTYGDLNLFFDAMRRMFDFDPSSSHGKMAIRGIHVFEHESALGNARAHELVEKVTIKPYSQDSSSDKKPLQSFKDYEPLIEVNLQNLPKGIAHYKLPADWDKLFPAS